MTNFNWYPTDPYGNSWRFVYYLDSENPMNYDKIEIAEVVQTKNNKWIWRFLRNSFFSNIFQGQVSSRDEAMNVVNSLVN
jgi:hypothetical protein